MSERNDLLEMCRSHFNEPMVSFLTIGRCIGYGEDEFDCYIVVREVGGGRKWHTCVGGYVWLDFLKGQEHVKTHSGEMWDDFKRLDTTLELNGAPKEAEFIIDIRPDDDWTAA